jgi:phosphoenolpyruvate carboxylase
VVTAEARGGLHIVEQSLWHAVPAFMRKLSLALKRHTGKDLPLNATPFRFGSWMGGDRDGNPNVTAKVGMPLLTPWRMEVKPSSNFVGHVQGSMQPSS